MKHNSSMVDQMVQNLLKIIEEENIEVGKKMPSEISLMNRFGVGRSTVREALRLMQAQGYVEIRPNAGAYLFSKNPDEQHALNWIASHKEEVLDVLQIRMQVESLSARLAATRATQDEIYCIIGIQTLMSEAAQADDTMKLALYDESFHEAIARATHNPLLENFTAQITSACAGFRGKTFVANKGERACLAHRAITEAIQMRDDELAEQRMREHMEENIEMIKLCY